jgi:hypothetical protein
MFAPIRSSVTCDCNAAIRLTEKFWSGRGKLPLNGLRIGLHDVFEADFGTTWGASFPYGSLCSSRSVVSRTGMSIVPHEFHKRNFIGPEAICPVRLLQQKPMICKGGY